MNPLARAWWKRIVEDYPPDHFRAGDLPLLRRYCDAYARAVRAERQVEKEGLSVPTGSGSSKANPLIAVGADADRDMKALAVALRICANSRTTPKQAGKEKTPAVTPSKRKMYRG